MKNKQENTKTTANDELTPLEKAIKKEKKRIWTARLVTLGLGIIFCFVAPEIAAFFLLAFLVYMLIGPFAIKELKRLFCENCGEKFDYENDVEWEVVEEISEGNSRTAVVEFTCTCGKCGDTKSFTKKFKVASYDSQKGTWRQQNLNTLCRKHFKV